MAYLDVITLARAKNYLRLDAGFTADDAEVTSMIKAACKFIELRTNHIFFAQDKVFTGLVNVQVYDFPINTLIAPTDATVVYFATSNSYTAQTSVTLNVGYVSPDDVPEELKAAVLQMLKVWYYESEKQVNTMLIPMSVLQAVDINRRFL
tara:strand:+ start:147 stop:596 length:450 start_codon:yes stop_codon:yes gene_type:complete